MPAQIRDAAAAKAQQAEGQRSGGRGRKKTLASREARVSQKARKSAHVIAQPLGISRATVERVEELMAKAPELVEQVAAGHLRLTEARRQLKYPHR